MASSVSDRTRALDPEFDIDTFLSTLHYHDPADLAHCREGLEKGEAWHGVFRNRKKDGSSYWAETTILPLLEPDGTIQNFIGISEDITEKRQARDQGRQCPVSPPRASDRRATTRGAEHAEPE